MFQCAIQHFEDQPSLSRKDIIKLVMDKRTGVNISKTIQVVNNTENLSEEIVVPR